MSGHKIDDCADSRIVQTVDQLLELAGGAVAGGRAEKPGALIAPASVKGMLGERHKLDMGIVVGFHILNQLIRNFFVGIPAVRIRLITAERTQMQLINIQRPVIAAGPLLHPFIISKFILVKIAHDRGKVRAQLHAESIGIAVLHTAVFSVDYIFVHLAGSGIFYKDLIKLEVDRHFHLFLSPVIEFSDDTDLICLRRIGAEHDSSVLDMGTHIFVSIVKIAVKKFLKIHSNTSSPYWKQRAQNLSFLYCSASRNGAASCGTKYPK